MKRKLILLLILIFSFCLPSFAYANETYISDWSIEVKNQNGETDCFKQGDFIELTIKNSHSLKNAGDSVVHFTYNTGLIEYVSTDDYKNVKEYFNADLNQPYIFADGAVGVANTENIGVFTAAFVSQNGIDFNEEQTVFKVYFKVLKTDIFGVCPLNFRWIKKGVYASYIAENSEENKNFNINFKDLYLNVKGDYLEQPEEELPGGEEYLFAPAVQPSIESPENINLNGTSLSLTTPYFVTFSKLVIRNSAFKNAGVIISKNNEDINLDSNNVTKVDAVNIGSDNCFGFLVYGNGIKTGVYYTRVYATYEDEETIYGKIIPIEIKGEE